MKTILVDAVNTFVCDGKIDKKIHEMLESFPNNKIILTNADIEKQIEFGLVDMPYPMFTQNFNPMKTDPLFYNNLLNEYSLRVEDVVYFEHSMEAVESARSVWIKTHYYDKNMKDVAEVEKFLRKNV